MLKACNDWKKFVRYFLNDLSTREGSVFSRVCLSTGRILPLDAPGLAGRRVYLPSSKDQSERTGQEQLVGKEAPQMLG